MRRVVLDAQKPWLNYKVYGVDSEIKSPYKQKDYLADKDTLPPVSRNTDIKTLNRDLTKRTLAEKLALWEAFADANILIAKKKAHKKFGDESKYQHFLKDFRLLIPKYEYKPCLVLGYGPSFHDILPRLKEIPRDKCKMIASERCLPEMYYHGILPDAVVNLDSGDQVKYFYFGRPEAYLDHLRAVGVVTKKGKKWVATKLGRETPISDPRSKSKSYKKDISHMIHHKYSWVDSRHRIIMQEVLDGNGTVEGIAKKLGIHPYKNVPTHNMDAIFAISTNPDVRKWFRGPIYWFNPNVYPWKNTFSYDIQKQTGLGVIPTAGNVGALSMCLALTLGSSPIFLIGMDFAHRVKGFDPSRLTMTEYQTFCPKCAAPYRSYQAAPEWTKCVRCETVFSPYDEKSKTFCTNTSYKAYAHSVKQLITSPSYGHIFKKARVINLSGGILHGDFIGKTSFDAFLTAMSNWDMEADMKRIKKNIEENGQPPRFRFKVNSIAWEDDDGNYWVNREKRERVQAPKGELKEDEKKKTGAEGNAVDVMKPYKKEEDKE